LNCNTERKKVEKKVIVHTLSRTYFLGLVI